MCRTHIVIFIPSFGDGGVEKMLVYLANEFVRRGNPVVFIVNQTQGAYFHLLEAGVERLTFAGTDDFGLARELEDYLRTIGRAVVMTGKIRDDRIALTAKRRLGDPHVRFFLRVGTAMHERATQKRRGFFGRWLHAARIRRLYRRADGIIANSEGVADDLARFASLPRCAIHVVPNPTVTPDLIPLGREPLTHAWFAPGEPPVIMGIGGLRRQKDFGTLLKAFAAVRAVRSCRLIILGRGRQEMRLRALMQRLGVTEDCELPGFVTNPYAWLARASLFVLSSRWEGCPNVLIEALAMGTPVVSTDCPAGPREILADGRYGSLVPVGDATALAAAMLRTLASPLPPDTLRQAVVGYTPEKSAHGYLRAFGLLGKDS